MSSNSSSKMTTLVLSRSPQNGIPEYTKIDKSVERRYDFHHTDVSSSEMEIRSQSSFGPTEGSQRSPGFSSIALFAVEGTVGISS